MHRQGQNLTPPLVLEVQKNSRGPVWGRVFWCPHWVLSLVLMRWRPWCLDLQKGKEVSMLVFGQ